MNPETTPLCEACITCITLEATTDEQVRLQESCAEILDAIAGWEMLLDEDATDCPEDEL